MSGDRYHVPLSRDLITNFALGALLLAFTGIYAVAAFSVSLRTQEVAIRIALGAQRTSICAPRLNFCSETGCHWVRTRRARFLRNLTAGECIPV